MTEQLKCTWIGDGGYCGQPATHCCEVAVGAWAMAVWTCDKHTPELEKTMPVISLEAGGYYHIPVFAQVKRSPVILKLAEMQGTQPPKTAFTCDRCGAQIVRREGKWTHVIEYYPTGAPELQGTIKDQDHEAVPG